MSLIITPRANVTSIYISNLHLSLLESLLSDRSLKGRVGSHVPSFRSNRFGVVQCSLIGTLIYLTYIYVVYIYLPCNAFPYANDLNFLPTETKLIQASVAGVTPVLVDWYMPINL